MRSLPLVLTLLLGSCLPDQGDLTLEITYDPCQVIVLTPEGEVLADELASIDDAIAHWNATGATTITRIDHPEHPDYSDHPDVQYLPIRFEEAAPAFFGVYEDEIGEVIVNRKLIDREQRAVTIAHEVGHALGLLHVDRDERRSVMHKANLSIWPTDSDAHALHSMWGECPDPSDLVIYAP